jgi:hypothetical protein
MLLAKAIEPQSGFSENPMPVPGIGFFMSVQQDLPPRRLSNFYDLRPLTSYIPIEWSVFALVLSRQKKTWLDYFWITAQGLRRQE